MDGETNKIVLSNLPGGTMRSDVTGIISGWIDNLTVTSIDLVPTNKGKRKVLTAYVALDSKQECDAVVEFFKQKFGDSEGFAYQNNFGYFEMVKVQHYVKKVRPTAAAAAVSLTEPEEWILSGDEETVESNLVTPPPNLSVAIHKIMLYQLPLATDYEDVKKLLKTWKSDICIYSVDIVPPKKMPDRLNAYVGLKKEDCDFIVEYCNRLHPGGYSFVNRAGTFNQIKVNHYTGTGQLNNKKNAVEGKAKMQLVLNSLPKKTSKPEIFQILRTWQPQISKIDDLYLNCKKALAFVHGDKDELKLLYQYYIKHFRSGGGYNWVNAEGVFSVIKVSFIEVPPKKEKTTPVKPKHKNESTSQYDNLMASMEHPWIDDEDIKNGEKTECIEQNDSLFVDVEDPREDTTSARIETNSQSTTQYDMLMAEMEDPWKDVEDIKIDKRNESTSQYNNLLAESEDPWKDEKCSKNVKENESTTQYDMLMAEMEDPWEGLDDAKCDNDSLLDVREEPWDDGKPPVLFGDSSETCNKKNDKGSTVECFENKTINNERLCDPEIKVINKTASTCSSEIHREKVVVIEEPSRKPSSLKSDENIQNTTTMETFKGKQKHGVAVQVTDANISSDQSVSDLDEMLKQMNCVTLCDEDVEEISGLLREQKIWSRIRIKTQHFNKVLEDTLQEKCKDFFVSEYELAKIKLDVLDMKKKIKRVNELKQNAVSELEVLKQDFAEYMN